MKDKKAKFIVIEEEVESDLRISDKAKFIYARIVYSSNNSRGYSYLSYEDLAKRYNISTRQVFKYIKQLVDCKYIIIVKTKYRTYFKPAINYMLQHRDEIISNTVENLEEIDYNWLDE